MDNSKILSRLELLEASATVILEEAAKLRKELQPAQQKQQGLTPEQKAKLLASMKAKEARQIAQARKLKKSA